MATKKEEPARSGGSPVGTTVAATEDKNVPAAAEYSIAELAAGVKTVFSEISPDCVTAALRMAGITKTTRERAREIVDKFVNEPVAGPRKGGS